MEKINPTEINNNSLIVNNLLTTDNTKKSKKPKKTAEKPFGDILTSEMEQLEFQEDSKQFNKKLETLFYDVKESGDSLKRNPTMHTVKEYRQKVKQFIQFVVNNALKVSKVNSRLDILTGSRKSYTLIQVIDEKLNELGSLLLQEQSSNLTLLQKVNEINGLLVNFLH